MYVLLRQLGTGGGSGRSYVQTGRATHTSDSCDSRRGRNVSNDRETATVKKSQEVVRVERFVIHASAFN